MTIERVIDILKYSECNENNDLSYVKHLDMKDSW